MPESPFSTPTIPWKADQRCPAFQIDLVFIRFDNPH